MPHCNLLIFRRLSKFLGNLKEEITRRLLANSSVAEPFSTSMNPTHYSLRPRASVKSWSAMEFHDDWPIESYGRMKAEESGSSKKRKTVVTRSGRRASTVHVGRRGRPPMAKKFALEPKIEPSMETSNQILDVELFGEEEFDQSQSSADLAKLKVLIAQECDVRFLTRSLHKCGIV